MKMQVYLSIKMKVTMVKSWTKWWTMHLMKRAITAIMTIKVMMRMSKFKKSISLRDKDENPMIMETKTISKWHLLTILLAQKMKW